MIPVRLTLRNFMCYQDNVSPLDFSGIHLACLSGDNGHGKSALLDAMTWALWGRSRARTEDELIHVGSDEMEVEFEFLLGANQYRVIRKRHVRKSGSLPSLEIAVKDGDGYRAITGNTVADSERRIADTLRMDYETFINSAYLMQGRADEFTVKPPGERKRILADILGLGLYDELEAQAREQARYYESERRALTADIEVIDQELANEPRYTQEHAAAQAASLSLADDLHAADAVLRDLREQKNTLDARSAQLKEVEGRLLRAAREIEQSERQLAGRRQRIREYEQALAQRSEIERGYTDLHETRRQNEALNKILGQLVDLQEKQRRAEMAVEKERSRLAGEQRFLADKRDSLAEHARQGAAKEAELHSAQESLAALDALEHEREAGRQRLQDETNSVAALSRANDVLRDEANSLKTKIETLAGVDHCPLCATPLSDEDRENVRQRYDEEVEQKRELFRRHAQEIKNLQSDVAALQTNIAGLDTRLRERAGVQRREAALAQLVAVGQTAAAELIDVDARLAQATQQIAAGAFAPAEQARLAQLTGEIEGLGYQAAEHERVRTKLAELSHFEGEKSRLETAAHLVASEKEAAGQLEGALGGWRKEQQADEEKAAALRAELATLPSLTATLARQQTLADRLQAEERLAREALGVARQKLEHCAYQKKQRQEKAEAENQARAERSLYEELAVAFGRKGIQAMIIEQVIPEIEDEANILLGRMTDNRMNIKFETQRDTKKGDTIETLDIKIADELGTRNYELYSGGESFRVNFAIRIALSKLLARRAGARLQTLIIDEGFGTQDSRGRERLVEAINSVSQDFEKILVITHIQELKDAFPVRIEITKTAQGSQILVT